MGDAEKLVLTCVGAKELHAGIEIASNNPKIARWCPTNDFKTRPLVTRTSMKLPRKVFGSLRRFNAVARLWQKLAQYVER